MNTIPSPVSANRNTNNGLAIVVASCLSFPVVLFNALNYDINPSFLLAPLIALAMIKKIDRIVVIFCIAAIAGAISIATTKLSAPDSNIQRQVFGLMLFLFAPSFFFLGRYLKKIYGLEKIFRLFAMLSTIFLVAMCARLLLLGEQVRIEVNGYAVLNANFLGAPVFAAFGVLSLANLILLQITMIVGATLNPRISHWERAAYCLGIGSGIFFLLGSDSRSSQVIIAALVVSMIINFILRRNNRMVLLVIFLVMLGSGLFSSQWFSGKSRLVQSLEQVASTQPIIVVELESSNLPETPVIKIEETKQVVFVQADTLSSGRLTLIQAGWREFWSKPFTASGFAGFKRALNSENNFTGENSSTHLYYLTILWKGGLVFAIPFFIFLTLTAWSSIAGTTRAKLARPSYWYTWTLVLIALGPMCFAWDILMVPSAGAVAFLFLGLLASSNNDAPAPTGNK